MPDKSLRDKAIKFNGKDYVQVKDRVEFFNASYENGSIRTEILKDEGDIIQVRATVIPDVANMERVFNGTGEEIRGQGFVNKTSALENCETSAIGRALAMMGIGVVDGIASIDEINLAQGKAVKQDTNPYWKKAKESEEKLIEMTNVDDGEYDEIDEEEITDEQINEIKVLATTKGMPANLITARLKQITTKKEAIAAIAKLRS
jgi:hypothetical protein